MAALALSAALLVGRIGHPHPDTLTFLIAAQTLLAALSPASALLAFIGLSPLSTVLVGLLSAPDSGVWLTEQLAMATAVGAIAVAPDQKTGTRLAGPALVLAVVALASALTMLPARMAPVAEGWDVPASLVRSFTSGAYDEPIWPALRAALLVLEGTLFALAAERTVRRIPALAPKLLLIGLVSHAGAAALNVHRIAGAALRSGDFWQTLPLRLLDSRASMQMDFNAAGSVLVLAAVAGLGAAAGTAWRKTIAGCLIGTCAAGVWVTGSRAAVLMGIFVPLGFGIWRLIRHSARARLWMASAAAALLLAGVLTALAYPAGRNDTIMGTIRSRLVLTELGLQMFQSAPVFGIGIDGFYDASAELAGPDLARSAGAPKENAHNNFVQVLAEQGSVGLVALLLVLVAALIGPASAAASATDVERSRYWLTAGLGACIGTWLTGHPLLVPEFVFVFYLYLGAAAGLSAPWPGRMLHWSAAASIVILLTVPSRAIAARDRVDLEHLGIGLSAWQHDDEQRYREAGSSFVLFLPAAGRTVTLPVRRAPGAPDPLELVWRSEDGRLGEATLTSDAWRDLSIPMSEGPRRYVRVEFEVRPAGDPASATRLRVGLDSVPGS